MATTRFSIVNLADEALATVKNGTGGGSIPARNESTGFLMENALSADRQTLWKTAASPGSTVVVDLDLGADRAISVAAVLGYLGTGFTSCAVAYATAAAGYYPASWTTVGSIPAVTTARDAGLVFAPATGRYWRFAFFGVSAQFSVGRLWLGAVIDTGFTCGEGSMDTPLNFGFTDRTLGGSPLVTFVGYEGRLVTLKFNRADATLRALLRGVALTRASFIYVDQDETFNEVVSGQKNFPQSYYFVTVRDVSVDLERLP